MTLQALLDHLAAAAWLIRARRRFGRHGATQLFAILSDASTRGSERRPLDLKRAERAIRRLARLMPFRADCVVQALAAKMWLDERGLDSRMKLAADTSKGLAAHVWMLSGDQVIAGGTLNTTMADFRSADEAPAGAIPSRPGP
ncbi:MAG: lasso peptide biosynthesis B2 protein [Pseudomonadota bacterium]